MEFFVIYLKGHYMRTFNVKFIFTHILRALACYLLFALVACASINVFRDRFEDMLSENILLAGGVLAILLSLQSSVRAFYEFDLSAKEAFLQGDRRTQGFWRECSGILRSPDFWIETICIFAFVMLTPYELLYADIAKILLPTESASYASLVSWAVMLPLIFTVQILVRASVRKNWLASRISAGKQKKRIFEYLRFLGRIALICFVYPVGFQLIPFVFAGASIAVFLVKSFLPTIIAVIVLILAIHYIRAIKIRQKFLKNLKKTCKEEGFELSEVKKPYRSIFFPRAGENFTVTANGKTYSCELLASVSRGARMIFDSEGNAVYVHTLKFRQFELFSYMHSTKYSFESEKRKILIVCPTPLKIFVGEGGRTRPIDTGEEFWGYKLFNATGFLRSLELDCIEVKSKYN